MAARFATAPALRRAYAAQCQTVCAHAAARPQSPVCGAHQPARRRPEAGEALCASARPARRRASSICCSICRPASIDRRARPKLRDVAARPDRHRRGHGRQAPAAPPHRSRAPYRIYASDDTGDITLTFFNARRDYLEKLLPEGETRYVSGTAEFYDGMLQMVHPDRVVDEAGFATLPLVEPVYPLTEGLALGNVRRAMDGALARLPDLPEWQDEAWVARERFPAFADALRHLHRPAEPHDIAPGKSGVDAACL